jgi:hypothetical protein
MRAASSQQPAVSLLAKPEAEGLPLMPEEGLR